MSNNLMGKCNRFYFSNVIGLLTAKGDIIEFTKNGKKSNYIVLELDDIQLGLKLIPSNIYSNFCHRLASCYEEGFLKVYDLHYLNQGKGKICCTLWEIATKLVKHIEEQPTSKYILIVQFAKFNLFKGTMGISNTTHNSILYINANFQAVKDFRKSVIMSGVPPPNQLSQIATEPVYSIEEDLINNSIYKSISELKECIENGSFVTIRTGVAINPKNGWWYKSCKLCFHSLKEAKNSYDCAKCDTYPTIHTQWYSINIKLVDDTDSAAFLLVAPMRNTRQSLIPLGKKISLQSLREDG
ncbi:hypothetical protein Ahy_B10g102367 [Arachis hypogaea]|uniref:Replication factor A C-terminal domain-containing protein n=1 Tax=Arachis hypogaea TaxID=3818 RepID=A0A444X1Y6_ARAHY|nr:hypothetical protein Ahy_B10g102367 [Arachis hypogaea]